MTVLLEKDYLNSNLCFGHIPKQPTMNFTLAPPSLPRITVYDLAIPPSLRKAM